MKDLSVRWQKLIVWFTGYVNVIAFVIAGGYLFKNTEHEEVKFSAKLALIVTAVFTALDALRLIIYNCVSLGDDYVVWLNDAYLVIGIIKVILFAVLLVVDLTLGFGSIKKNADKKVESQGDESDE